MSPPHTPAQDYDQKFSDYEQIYLRMSKAFAHLNKEHWAIHCVVSFELGVEIDHRLIGSRLKTAWKHLLLEHPGLSVTPRGSSKVFAPIDDTVADRFVDSTFNVSSSPTTDTSIAECGPLDLPRLYYLPTSSEILFISQHWRHDALGTCMLMNRFFCHLSDLLSNRQPQSSPHLATPAPSLEDAAGAEQGQDLAIQQYAQEYIDHFHKRAVNASGFPYQESPSTLPGNTAHLEMTFDSKQTEEIVAACKSRNISVSAAVHAGLAEAVLEKASAEQQNNGYTAVMAVNMRDHLPPPANTASHACQTYVASITPTVRYGSDLVDAARQLTREYKSWYSDRFRRALRWIYRYHAIKLFTPPPSTGPARPLPSGVTLSSLGIIERYLPAEYDAGIRLKNFRFGVSMYTRQMLLYVWTFKGRMCLSMDYNDAYYTSDMVEEALVSIRNALSKGLNLDLAMSRV